MAKQYNLKQDTSGKTMRENAAIRSFWSKYKVADIMQLTPEEIDNKINIWIEEFETAQMKRVRGWWYPEIYYDPAPKKKGPRKINTEWNSSFSGKKMI